MKKNYLLVTCIFFSCIFLKGIGQTVWNGPTITFTKVDGTDPTQSANQDRITSSVWLTRANSNGLYNAASEGSYGKNSSPANTEWAYGTLANYLTLSYKPWETLNGSKPPSMVNKDAVLHIISDNIYIGIKFLSWSQSGSGGGFSYQRTTASSLPVTLKQFSGALQSNNAVLQWQTATEINSQYFVIQHSNDGINFTSVGTVAANGNSTKINSYSYTHSNVKSGKHYYRLAQYDLDGNVSYSQTIVLSSNLNSLLELYPNPATSVIKLATSTSLAEASYTITSLIGQTIKKGIINNQQIKVEELSPGLYWLTIKTETEQFQSQFIKR
jgi:hypothetical protein